MTPTELTNNIKSLHQANNSCKHPSQTSSTPTTQDQVPGQPQVSSHHQVPGQAQVPGQSQVPGQLNTNQPILPTQPYQQATNAGGTAGFTSSNANIFPGWMNNNPTPQATATPKPEYEVTQHCPIAGCPYSSFPTTDPSLLASCVEMIKIHLAYAHDKPTTEMGESSSRPSNPDKAFKEYQEATRQREIKKVKDDASRNLCEARYFAAPLDMKILAQNMPVSTTPVNTVVDFSHLGVDVSSKETIRRIHSRACTSFKLRDFSDSNLKTTNTAGDEMVAVQYSQNNLQLSRKMKSLDSPQECVKAAYNYAAIYGQFHPLDWSPRSLLKVFLDKLIEGPPTVDQFIRLFEKYISENGGRAQKKAIPLTYMEIIGLWTTFIAPSPLNLETIEKTVDRKLTQFSSKFKNFSSSNDQSPSKRQRTEYCKDWNTSKEFPLCTNTQSNGGCTVGGTFLKHSCSRRNSAGKICGSEGHGYYKH